MQLLGLEYLTFLSFQPCHGATQVQETLGWITMSSSTGKKLEPYRNGTARGCQGDCPTPCYLQPSISLSNTRASSGGPSTGPPDTPHPLYYGKKTSSCDQVQELLQTVAFLSECLQSKVYEYRFLTISGQGYSHKVSGVFKSSLKEYDVLCFIIDLFRNCVL